MMGNTFTSCTNRRRTVENRTSDAYGLSTEFEKRKTVASNYPDRSKIIPFPDYKLTGHSSRCERGDWTDDTDQWILILETLIEGNGDERIFAKKLERWIEYGFPELNDSAGMGLGANIQQVVFSHGYLRNPIETSRMIWEHGNRQAALNEAVMRYSAAAFVHFDGLEKVTKA
ncbi:unnamed protein product [Adineta steineri]|uniref:Uncharacterized protein n=1 Tax=Adineta steineri TaxID=433720 RepID=A0A813SKG1_9BILA|nr:unnamed protein product [Adineta steineri]CAF1187730.1 unnamed protein product [Adineta steineri]